MMCAKDSLKLFATESVYTWTDLCRSGHRFSSSHPQSSGLDKERGNSNNAPMDEAIEDMETPLARKMATPDLGLPLGLGRF